MGERPADAKRQCEVTVCLRQWEKKPVHTPEQERMRGVGLVRRPRAEQVCEWVTSLGAAWNTSSVYVIVWRLREPRGHLDLAMATQCVPTAKPLMTERKRTAAHSPGWGQQKDGVCAGPRRHPLR